MNRLHLYQITEINNGAAALIVDEEYAQGMEKLQVGLGQLQAHLSQLSGSNIEDIYSDSLDEWMYPAVEALQVDDRCGPTASSFFVYRRPLVAPPLKVDRTHKKANAEYLKTHHKYVTGEHTNLWVAMLFNYGLACHLSYIDHEGRLNNGSRPEYDLLQRASQMYDLAITSLRNSAASKLTERRDVVSSNIQFFRAAMNNLAICEQTRYGLLMASSTNGPCPIDILFNKGFERLRELLRRYPSESNDTPERALWSCYMANILRVVSSFHPNYCAAAC
ncbi:unnamed protein product [Cylindrotheca closterium]|uniref:Uncharacterized protein n=1 Tax=Cylindrotheca closterium TaxID=2856 RepID=A0AAD2G7S6_9STRA|nr:unnamed protein product [Cylindrotheca closterium]